MKDLKFFRAFLISFAIMPLSAQTGIPKKWIVPKYPNIARAAQIAGIEEIALTINEKGAVTRIQFRDDRSKPQRLLFKAIEEALLQWEFEPGKSRTESITLVFHLFPLGTPDSFLQNEFVAPGILVIKARVIPPDVMSDSFSTNQ